MPIRNKKAMLCHIIPIIVVIGFILLFAAKQMYKETVGECKTNSDCGDSRYCGSDKKCYNMPVTVKRDFTSALIISGISVIIAFIILKWPRKKIVHVKLSKPEVQQNIHYYQHHGQHQTGHHQQHSSTQHQTEHQHNQTGHQNPSHYPSPKRKE